MTEQRHIKIFLLDDNAIDREACRRCLRQVPDVTYDFVEHNSIDGALELLAKHNPDCVVLDYHLHDGNGMEFLKSLSEEGLLKRVPVVMLTGTGSEKIAVDVMKMGAKDYISKDRLNPEILHRTIESAIYRSSAERVMEEQRLEMKRLYDEAQLANARKDEFLAALSHELRTPLTPILAAVSQSDLSRFTRDDFVESFAIIRRNVELEARLIDDMLDLTRIARGKLEIHARAVDLREVLLHAGEACETERKNKWIELISHIPADLPKIHADGARIQQVIWNVLKNAIKFTPDSGTIEMDARRIDDRIEIRVSDTGVGLRPGMEEKIFNAFEQGGVQVTRHFGGLGLGLAISKALIEAHHGTISAANRTDRKGAVFTITLPVTQEASNPAPTAPATSSATPEGHGRIVLLVEDHYDTRVLIGRLLSRAGFQVIQAQCAAEALTLYRSAKVDYIISDLGLPDASGLELMEQIQAIRPVPAIALSGYGMEHDVQRAHQVGFSRHLTKPVDLTQILEALKSLPEFPATAK